MNWFSKLMPSSIRIEGRSKKNVPEGLWNKCGSCDAVLYQPELERNAYVCPKCDFHMAITARDRLASILDQDCDVVEIASELEPTDPLKFKDTKRYTDRIKQAQKNSGESDALVAQKGTLFGRPLVACAFEFRYMGGSMGSVVGERFARAGQQAIQAKCPMVAFAASGGARMQESLFSLMQMAKTSAVIAQMRHQRLPFISVLTHPTTGGVSASFAMLGDVNIAEPRALIGFAGPRVIAQTVRETLPPGFQRSEFLLEHGAVDMIVDRRKMRETLHRLTAKFMDSVHYHREPVEAQSE